MQNNSDIKTRRILEVQSDLFQKARNKKDLISNRDLFETENKLKRAKENNEDDRIIKALEEEIKSLNFIENIIFLISNFTT